MSDNTIQFKEHGISLDQAIAMTRRYRQNREVILGEEFKGKDILPLSETFNKDAFASFFTNPLVKGLRVYYGMSDNLLVHAIIVGVNEQNQDMLPSQVMPLSSVSATTNEDIDPDEPEIIDDSIRCPPACPEPSPLNES